MVCLHNRKYIEYISDILPASWRDAFGQAGLLNFASGVLTAEGASDDLKIQALRLIGNSCADTGKQATADADKAF